MTSRSRLHLDFLYVLAIAWVMTAAGCFGTAARTNVSIPAMELAFDGLSQDALAGGATQESIDAFKSALNTKSESLVILLWPPIRDAARAGVETKLATNAIGPIGAQILADRIVNFDALVVRLQTRFAEEATLPAPEPPSQ